MGKIRNPIKIRIKQVITCFIICPWRSFYGILLADKIISGVSSRISILFPYHASFHTPNSYLIVFPTAFYHSIMRCLVSRIAGKYYFPARMLSCLVFNKKPSHGLRIPLYILLLNLGPLRTQLWSCKGPQLT